MDKARIFISYAREDEQAVRRLHRKLIDAGFEPWLDKVDLLPGEQWQPAIEKALREADFLIICLSNTSVQKRGFVQREFKTALDLWQDKLSHDIYLIPVRLEHCEPPGELSKFQWLDLFDEENEWPRLIRALQVGMQRRGRTIQVTPPADPARTPSKVAPPAPIIIKPRGDDPPKDAASLPLMTYGFTTVLLDARGKIVEQRTEQARSFSDDLGGGVKLEMTYLSGGTFFMGTSDAEAPVIRKEIERYWKNGGDWVKTEMPRREVRVPSFFIGKFQVTRALWRAVARLPKAKVDLKLEPSSFTGNDALPVETVSWEDAQEFCLRLRNKTGKAYRLPSEAEWEYACRAGTMTPFAFGETITPEIVNYDGNYPYANASKGLYRMETAPVGSLGVANPWGLFDMHGSVWEWCEDVWHENYDGAPSDGSAWLSGGDSSYRVLRGGSWNDDGRLCRSADRFRNGPGLRHDYGFRVVVSARIG
jgi:formylglycine-generating enzyme required for sulfatase activity